MKEKNRKNKKEKYDLERGLRRNKWKPFPLISLVVINETALNEINGKVSLQR